MTASPSLHLSAGMDFRHCLDSRKRPGKNIDPAARMVSMVPGDLSQRQEVQQAIWSLRSVTLSPLWKNRKRQRVSNSFTLISLLGTPLCMLLAALTEITALSKSSICGSVWRYRQKQRGKQVYVKVKEDSAMD